jgi:hypothetical protein
MKRKQKRKLTAWNKHLMAYKKAHPGKTLTQCMKLASASYNPNK